MEFLTYGFEKPRIIKCFVIYNEDTIQIIPKLYHARLVPLNKANPNKTSSNEFRPIVILSAFYKFIELRFLHKLNKYLSERMSKD